MNNLDLNNPEFSNALEIVNKTTQTLFLTGRAGTGKSTFLRYIAENTHKKCIVLAPTGIAAINAGGVTIHSFFKFPFRPLLPDDPDFSLQGRRIFDFLKYKKEHIRVLEEAQLFIIDEISMVRADIIDSIDRVLRVFSGNMRLPLGGKQLLLVGDVFQLEPVVKGDEKDILKRYYTSPFFFSARLFKEINLVSIELRKVYRQTDSRFVNLLDRIRENKLKQEDLAILNSRHRDHKESDFNIILGSRRDVVDRTNEIKLEALKEDIYSFKGIIDREFPSSNLPTDFILNLKKGAQVMFIKNDPDKRWYNGSIGVITYIDSSQIMVLLDTGNEHDVELETWENIRYKYNEEKKCVEEENIGSFTQYPIKLAWAITIHKSQGLTFEEVTIDLGRGAFAGGQTYVALSRSRSLDGINLKQQIQYSDIFVRKEVVDFSKEFNNKLLIQESLTAAHANDLYLESLNSFKKGSFLDSVNMFVEANKLQSLIDESWMKRFIARKLQIIKKQRQTIRDLESRIMQSSVYSRSISEEFYELAEESIKIKNIHVAKANLVKAITLYPNYLNAHILKAQLHYNSEEYEEALICFNSALSIERCSFSALFGRGRTFIQIERPDCAIDDLLKALQISPNHTKCRHALGDAYSKIGDILNAAEYWK